MPGLKMRILNRFILWRTVTDLWAVEEMLKIADRTGLSYLFEKSLVYLLAPAGLIADESLGRVAEGWKAMMKSEATTDRLMTYPDRKGIAGKQAIKAVFRNPLRMWAEVQELVRRRVDLNFIAKHVDMVADYALCRRLHVSV